VAQSLTDEHHTGMRPSTAAAERGGAPRLALARTLADGTGAGCAAVDATARRLVQHALRVYFDASTPGAA
jgi:hypothetical protein